MNTAKDWHQGTKMSNRRRCFTILHSLLLIFLWSGQAMAACQTTSIIASTPTADFMVNGDGTVTDIKTGLMWKVCSEGQAWGSAPACTGTAPNFTWQNALLQAQSVNNGSGFAGNHDWRVPNKKALASIVEVQCISPSINAAIFPATVSGAYWSASLRAGNAVFAWVVNFNDGADGEHFKTNSFSVRLVRGGQ